MVPIQESFRDYPRLLITLLLLPWRIARWIAVVLFAGAHIAALFVSIILAGHHLDVRPFSKFVHTTSLNEEIALFALWLFLVGIVIAILASYLFRYLKRIARES